MLINAVAPFAGAWIEIGRTIAENCIKFVAPFAGAWIEINYFYRGNALRQSLPSRERGLKWNPSKGRLYLERVAPFAGAWIEIDIFYL